jgi:hypothetical protein
MKLLIKKSKQTGETSCKFSGNPIDAIEAILIIMSQEEIIAKIILAAAECHTEKAAEIRDEILENSEIVMSNKTHN